MPSRRVIMLPGIVLPASLAYQALIDVLGSDVQAMAKDLEVYAGSAPPPDYTLELEVEGIVRLADEQGWDRFHLVGYSAGGASITAFAARHPDRVRSLELLEPAWAGNWDDMSDAHRRLRQEYQQLERLPPDQFISEFMRLGVRPGVELPPPPPGDPPPWMDLRPAGIRAVLKTFRSYDLDRSALQRFDRPVYFALGGLSNPDDYVEIGERLGRTFPDFTLEVFPHRHHFDPPHRLEPEKLGQSLHAVWERAQPS